MIPINKSFLLTVYIYYTNSLCAHFFIEMMGSFEAFRSRNIETFHPFLAKLLNEYLKETRRYPFSVIIFVHGQI